MVDYTDIPSLAQFESDSRVTFAFRSSDPALSSIDDLLKKYHSTPENKRHEILYYLLLSTRYWISKKNRIPGNSDPRGFTAPNNSTRKLPTKPKLSAHESRSDAINALNSVVMDTLRDFLGLAQNDNLDNVLSDIYERANLSAQADAATLQNAQRNAEFTTVYINDDRDRRKYKLRFRDGVAWRWYHPQQPHVGYVKFDTTDNAESEVNDQKVHYAMTPQGRIYAGFDGSVVWFKHSSLTGGGNVLAAGRMKVVDGSIRVIDNDSGHYQPGAREMVNVLQRLRLYGVDVGKIMVERHPDNAQFTAQQMLSGRPIWPDKR